MDLGAYSMIEDLKELLPSEPPRLRGIRLMKFEDPIKDEMFDKYCGKDVLYIHTRCGQCRFDGEDNYEAFGMNEWEEELKELFLEGKSDLYDCTYRDTYILVPKDKLKKYQEVLKDFE